MFLPHKSDNGAILAWEYLPGAAGSYVTGQLVKVTAGKVSAITADTTTTPPYLCMATITLPEGELLPVTRVSDEMQYGTTLAADAAAAVVGGKLQVASGGLQAKTGAGTFEIVSLEGTTEGSVVIGRWA